MASLLSVLDSSTLGSVSVKAIVLSLMMGTPGLGFLRTTGTFFFSPTRGFFKGPWPTFLTGTNLVVLKRKGPDTFGFLVPFIAIFLLTRGLVLAITGAVESVSGPSEPLTFRGSAFFLPSWSKTCTSDDFWSLSSTSCPGGNVTCVVKAGTVTLGNVFPKDVKGMSIWIQC